MSYYMYQPELKEIQYTNCKKPFVNLMLIKTHKGRKIRYQTAMGIFINIEIIFRVARNYPKKVS